MKAALAATFPTGAQLSDPELQMVYRSLDPTNRGHITLSTFSSVFSKPRALESHKGGAPYYMALPTWGATVGGCLDRDESYRLQHAGNGASSADVELQHGGGYPGGGIRTADLRGVAGGFGLGHAAFGDQTSLGYELIAHSDLHAKGVLRWGPGHTSHEPPQPVRPPPPPKRKQPQPPKPVMEEQRPLVHARSPPRGPPKAEVERRRRWFMARKLQRAYRPHLSTLLSARRRHEAACRVQASVLRRQAALMYAVLRTASVHAQRLIRGLLGRLSYAAALRELRRLQAQAAVTIQRQAKRRSFRTVVARVRIQRSFRAHLCRKLLRSLMAAKKAREEMERMRAAMAMAEQEASRLRGLGGR